MRVLLDRLKGFAELLLLAVMLVSWGSSDAVAQFFSNPGGGSGGFTGRPLITVEISADKTSVPVNLAGFGPNPSLPYTSTLTAVVKQDGRLLPTDIQFDLAPNLAQGTLFDPADLTKGFRSLPVKGTSGLSTVFFQASATPGTVTITASAQDPNTKQTVSSSVQITVVGESRPATSIAFTGPYVNAVIAGESRFGTPPIQNGAYSRVVSVVVNDANGNPTNPNTKINFFLIDAPITGYPNNPGAFFVAGNNGDPQENGLNFSALGGQFLTKGVRPFQRLVLNGGQYRTIQTVTSEESLTIQASKPFGSDSRAAIPYVIGHAENAAILSPSFTDLSGVASTILTYPVTRVGQTAILMACTDDYVYCGMLNTCDINGANCKSVYLGVTNGSDRVLTVSATSLGPNRTTNVQMCLRDVNFTPLPATEIRYDIGSTGPAKVTVNDVEGNKGKLLTGEEGCTTVKIASSGQIPGGLPIDLNFTSDFVAAPIKVTIKSPGAGKMDGFFNCEFATDQGTASCKGTLRLTDDEGSPMAGVLIAVGQVVAPGEFVLTFNPAEGVFGKTDESGQLQVSVDIRSPGQYTFPFQTAAGGTAKYELKVGVAVPGTLKITPPTTATATVGQPYSGVFLADGGVPPYSWSLLAGQLPQGLSFSSNGSITGTPAAGSDGVYSISVQATDSKKQTGFATFTLTVGSGTSLKVTMVGPTTATIGTLYSAVFQADSGIPPYTWELLSGLASLPKGLVFDASKGLITGTPTTEGTFSFSVQATDSKGQTGSGAFTITVGDGSTGDPLAISTSTLPDGTTSTFYTALLQATGGKTPYIWSIFSGVLPAGITLDGSKGVLSGTPTSPGVFNLIMQVADGAGKTALANLALTVKQSGGGGGSVTPSGLILLVSSPDLPSSGQPSVTLTAVASDSKGVVLKDVGVQFQVKSTEADGKTPNGTIQVITSVTDDKGVATASLSTGGNKRNRIITVGAVSGEIVANPVNVTVTGTTLKVSGVDSGASVLVGDTLKLIFELKDSASVGISGATLSVSSVLNGLALPPAKSDAKGSTLSVTTNSSGVVEVNLKINQNGTDEIKASWVGGGAESIPLSLTASSDKITIEVVDANTNQPDVIGINSSGNIRVTWTSLVNCGDPNGCLVSPADISLVVTKGTLVVTNPGGNPLLATISSSVPGGAVITATGNTTRDGQPVKVASAPKSIQFVSTEPLPSKFVVQADPATIPVNVPPSTSSQSTITATVRDANDNPVPGIQISFKVIKDASGGTVSAASAVTDFSGQASVVYFAGSSTTPDNGVEIQATASSPVNLTATTTLTVSKREVFITLGTGNTITEPDPTTYALPYNVLVNDIVGGAVQGATVTLNTVPLQYRKGQYVWNGVVWVPVVAISCPNEDTNNNGILDPGEDVNNNGHLDPGNVVTTSVAAITTDKDGFGKFDVLYAQQYASWINNNLTARTKVNGSEGEQSSIFVLPPSAADVGSEKISPPGQPSPFGVLPNCAVSVEKEVALKLSTIPPASVGLSIPVAGASLGPLASVSSSVTVTVELPGFSGDLTGTTITAQGNSIVSNVSIAVPSSLATTGPTALFNVTVTNTSITNSVPVSATGTPVGTVTFAVGNAKAVVPIRLVP
ncbi:putative Ig domain-containing protein [Candidatus Contendibacter odensensis]|uniref:Dystroglycan-type cadherin-like domain-containing protein n=1 Tax=Candidatus Contendobacter odensis Run_B_J11 TaxID=1400861 RepID=A0A7U7J4K2_9GAMM|nr:putative Ig domain-containing protein [Candidatus Contendobacter odensis]CDH47361.1 exported hypothetical protein [Candidatus Contendobacter odensis Run_B_J11]